MKEREQRLARLRHAFAEDWARIRRDTAAGWHDLVRELGAVDDTMLGFHDEQLHTLDDALDDLERWMLRARAEVSSSHLAGRSELENGLNEVAAQIADARRRRHALDRADASERNARIDDYAQAVARVSRAWQSLGTSAPPAHP
jgi:hypothetical protein